MTTDHEKNLLRKNERRHIDIPLQCKNRPKTPYVGKCLAQMLPFEFTNLLNIMPEDDPIGLIQKRRSEQAFHISWAGPEQALEVSWKLEGSMLVVMGLEMPITFPITGGGYFCLSVIMETIVAKSILLCCHVYFKLLHIYCHIFFFLSHPQL